MSQTSIEIMIGRAILNEAFRQLLFENPDQALDGLSFTDAEKSKLRRVDSETLELLANILNERLGWLRLADKPHLRNGYREQLKEKKS